MSRDNLENPMHRHGVLYGSDPKPAPPRHYLDLSNNERMEAEGFCEEWEWEQEKEERALRRMLR